MLYYFGCGYFFGCSNIGAVKLGILYYFIFVVALGSIENKIEYWKYSHFIMKGYFMQTIRQRYLQLYKSCITIVKEHEKSVWYVVTFLFSRIHSSILHWHNLLPWQSQYHTDRLIIEWPIIWFVVLNNFGFYRLKYLCSFK